MKPTIDYALSKLFHDLHTDRALAAEYRRERASVLGAYELKDDVRTAVLADDVVSLARWTNPFLLRYYFSQTGMPDAVFIERLQPLARS